MGNKWSKKLWKFLVVILMLAKLASVILSFLMRKVMEMWCDKDREKCMSNYVPYCNEIYIYIYETSLITKNIRIKENVYFLSMFTMLSNNNTSLSFSSYLTNILQYMENKCRYSCLLTFVHISLLIWITLFVALWIFRRTAKPEWETSEWGPRNMGLTWPNYGAG